LEKLIKSGKDVVLDNTFPTVEVRKPFIDTCKSNKTEIHCIYLDTSIEDAQINALNRMYERYNKIFFDVEQLKEVKKDPNMFPITVFFKYRNEFQKPSMMEGFTSIEGKKFVRQPYAYTNKAIILDFDDTLREVKNGEFKYPVKKEEVSILAGRKERLQQAIKDGYVLLGASNQSGIAKKKLTNEAAIECFDHTCDLLGVKIDYKYCPHNIPPASCYCRKPQSGMLVHFIHKYKLNPKDCIFVGDSTSDKTAATRVGMQYQTPQEFFGRQK
jgi:D-glycero-D-manno-heptose 1,7-bisphosphate phosphatase